MKKNKLFVSVLDYIKRADKIFWAILILISTYSLLILNSVSRSTNTNYFNVQLVAILLGVFCIYIISLIDYASFSNFWVLIAWFSVFLMVYTIFFGINISGSGGVDATAWIGIGGMTFQPSELVKIAFMVTYAKHCEILIARGKINKLINVVTLAIHALVPVLLCNLQGDDGAGIVFFFMFLFMSYAAGVQKRYFIFLAVLILIAIPILWNFVLSDYQILRFSAVYNLDDPTVAINEGYQQYQARISIASGGLFGYGLYNGPRVEYSYVTFQHSDFIFSVVGEELGLFGCSLVIALLLWLMNRVLHIANCARDFLGKIMCYGFFGLIAIQSIANIGMCIALLPVVGLTLPFFSAGGTSAVCLYLGVGILQSVYMHKDYVGGVRLKYRNREPLTYKNYKDLGL